MKVQKVKFDDHKYIWLVIGEDLLPIEPIESYIGYLYDIESSPSTIQSYANHLKLFWEYLTHTKKTWKKITIADLAKFIHWLRSNDLKIVHIHESKEIRRTERTVNTILSALASFYRYHKQLGNTDISLTEACNLPVNRHKSLLHHIYKHKPIWKRIIKLKEPKNIVKTLNNQQISKLLDSCNNLRDQFLLNLLYETGMRIGQALGLRHSDIKSWDNEIHLIYRLDNVNQSRNKSKNQNIVCVSSELMSLYSEYLDVEYELVEDSDYVFMNYLTRQPLTYSGARNLLKRLSNKVGFNVTAHMFRHTHATELINHGWDPALVQKRLGHSNVQTTIDTYAHISQKELKKQFKIYQNNKKKVSNECS